MADRTKRSGKKKKRKKKIAAKEAAKKEKEEKEAKEKKEKEERKAKQAKQAKGGPWLAFSVECLELPLAHFGTSTTCRLPFGFDLGLAFHASKIGKHCRYCKHWRVHNIQ